MEIHISGWFGFWIFTCVFFIIDMLIFMRGYDSFMQAHKTDAEKEIQSYKISILKSSAICALLLVEEKKLKASRFHMPDS